jgi:Zn-dependent M28 family amino/carboxypeptidase
MRSTRYVVLLSLMVLVALVAAGIASAAVPTNSTQLRNAVTVAGIMEHERAFQAIADANDNTRASGTPGYDASVDYVAGKLEAAGYDVTIQPFTFPFFEETGPSTFERLTPTARTYVRDTDYSIMDHSASGDVTGSVVPTNDIQIPPSTTPSSTSGCERSDFPAETENNVALIQRGTCDFAVKVQNAEAAGAVAAIIFNEGQEGRTGIINGSLGAPAGIPALDTTFAVGEELYELANAGDTTVHIVTQTVSENRDTANVIANTTSGRTDRTVVVGAHLDSVPEGPGINDNGSGSAMDLEIALQMAELDIRPRNQVRFAFWGAEESGLLGSEHYVAGLSSREKKNIAVNLNFDMVGSPNYVRFVYDGDGSETPESGPNGSEVVEKVFNDYFASKRLATDATAFDGRSDYGPFIAAGIPAGGLFTGAEGIKTPEQQAVYGGTAGEPYDPCYHQACDDINNLSSKALDEMSNAAAHAALTFAQTTSAVNGTEKGTAKGVTDMEFKGPNAQK